MPQRQLAAIMFTDIVGYTALMGKDSTKALELVHISKEIQKPLVEKHNGKWLKEMGDGAMAQFSTALDAVNCSLEIQEQARAKFDEKLRIGIHLGDITIENEDVYGDGVNVASRLESIADPGGIYISDAIEKAMQGQSEVQAKYLGEVMLKNVAYGVRTYALQGVGLPVPDVRKVEKTTKSINMKWIFMGLGFIVILWLGYLIYKGQFKQMDESSAVEETEIDKSIAVMSFDNESDDTKNEYFVNGMMEDIRNNLSKIGDLRVISKTSTEKYRTTTLSSSEIGKELSINYLLEGTVQKLGNQVKIHAQLISTENDDHVWQDTYQRDISDIKEVFKIQSSIAQAIADELEAVITLEEEERISTIPTENAEAYESYLKGRYIQSDLSLNNLEASIKYFERAIDLDSLFAEAYTAVGGTYAAMGSWYGNLSGKEASKLGNPYFYKALEIDPMNAQALSYLGKSKYYFDWDFKAADSLNRLAYKMSDGLEWNQHLPLMLGDFDQVISLSEKIMGNDPFAILHWQIAYAYLFKGDTVKTISLMQQGLDLHPNQESYFDHFADIYIELGDYDRAISLIDKGLDISYKKHASMLINKAIALYKKDSIEEAEKYVMEVIDRANNGESEINYFISHYYSQTGNLDEAFKWLELAYENHEVDMIWLIRQLSLAPIRSDPRYFDLVRRVGFPD